MAEKKRGPETAAPAEDKRRAIETAMAQIERAYGKGSIMRLGENAGVAVEAIPTGSIALDLALGIGGVPRGRIVEIYGPESSGKTTLALHIVAEAQKRGARWPLWTPSTRWIPPTRTRWAWTSTACSSPSRTPASRRWKSPRGAGSAPAPSTWWSWTPWRALVPRG